MGVSNMGRYDITYLRRLNFHKPQEEEIKKIRRVQRIRRWQRFILRMAFFMLLILLVVAMQTVARMTLPHWFSASNTVEVLGVRALIVFVVLNILSYMQLIYDSYVLFDEAETEIAQVRVRQKFITKKYLLFTVKQRWLICEAIIPRNENKNNNEYTGQTERSEEEEQAIFIEEKIEVRGIINYATVKEGDMVYIERIKDEGKYTYHYVA